MHITTHTGSLLCSQAPYGPTTIHYGDKCGIYFFIVDTDISCCLLPKNHFFSRGLLRFFAFDSRQASSIYASRALSARPASLVPLLLVLLSFGGQGEVFAFLFLDLVLEVLAFLLLDLVLELPATTSRISIRLSSS